MKAFIHNLLSAVVPDVPCYVVLESENPPEILKGAGAYGTTGRKLDLFIMDWLKARGDWQGRQPAIWLNDVALVGIAEQHEYDLSEGLVAVALHEVGHVTEGPIDLSSPAEEFRLPMMRLAAYTEQRRQSMSLPPFYQHGWKFVRNCCHLHFRARRAGYEIPAHWIFDGDGYELPELDEFMRTLNCGMEMADLLSVPIHQINSFRASESFTRLWQQSVRRWLNQQTEYSEACRVAIDMLDVTPDEIE